MQSASSLLCISLCNIIFQPNHACAPTCMPECFTLQLYYSYTIALNIIWVCMYGVCNAHMSSPRLIGCEQALTLHNTHIAIVTATANSRKDPTACHSQLPSLCFRSAARSARWMNEEPHSHTHMYMHTQVLPYTCLIMPYTLTSTHVLSCKCEWISV